VQLVNGFYQTEYKDPKCECNPEKDTCCENWIDVTRRETIEGAEMAIDSSVEHYQKKVEFLNGPKVVKTFK
jgi:hypothetical protein